jgi:hypothetical protein
VLKASKNLALKAARKLESEKLKDARQQFIDQVNSTVEQAQASIGTLPATRIECDE